MKAIKGFVGLFLIAMMLLGLNGCSDNGNGDRAEDVLMRYFALLHEGEYAQAAELYGGTYDILIDWNPTVDANDHSRLLEMGCTVNGLQCLPVKTLGAQEDSAANRFEFQLQFENPDGSTFMLEPPTVAQTQVDFKYTVEQRGDAFVVLELPVYVP